MDFFKGSSDLPNLGFKWRILTFKHGLVMERINHALATLSWHVVFPTIDVIHLLLKLSNQVGLQIRLNPSSNMS